MTDTLALDFKLPLFILLSLDGRAAGAEGAVSRFLDEALATRTAAQCCAAGDPAVVHPACFGDLIFHAWREGLAIDLLRPNAQGFQVLRLDRQSVAEARFLIVDPAHPDVRAQTPSPISHLLSAICPDPSGFVQ